MHDPNSRASGARFALTPVALVAMCLLQAAHAQPAEPSPQLKPSPQLREDIPAGARDAPTSV